jgi:phenylacetate-coenzyme A ligase PaaK-like adenylate-forming protein
VTPLDRLPFYRARMRGAEDVEPWRLDDLEDFAATSGDPFAGRVAADDVPPIALQIEATSDPIVWTALERKEIDAWAAGLARLWGRYGLERGETIAFFDYGSSPPVLLSSASYVAGLRRGAADRLGATSICNDGVASMTARMASILELVRPAALVLRRDLLAPLADALRTTGPEPGSVVRWIAVVDVEGAAPKREIDRFAGAWGVPVRRILRADAAFFLAGDCAECGLFHVDASRYALERVAGEVAVTTRFASRCPAVRHLLGEAEIVRPGCVREPRARRIAWE